MQLSEPINHMRSGLIYTLLGCVLIGGCASPGNYQNVLAADSAQVWVADESHNVGYWSITPGNSSVGVSGLDKRRFEFPPSAFIGFGVDYSRPLYLAPGPHSISVVFLYTWVNPAPGVSPDYLEFRGTGTFDAQFDPNRKYRITAWFGEGDFQVTLWEINDGEKPGTARGTWRFDSMQTGGPPWGYPRKGK